LVKPERVPYDEAQLDNLKRDARLRLQVAQQRGDSNAEFEARSQLAGLRAKPYNANQSPTLYMFSRLSVALQKHLLEEMSAEERLTYLRKARPEVKRWLMQLEQQKRQQVPQQ
jgi:hypothetical protein